MMKKRLNLAYITNDSMRKSTFNKRKKGLFKKIHELSVLCGIEACAVIYGPSRSTPEVWPSNSGVKNVLEMFENVPEFEQEKKMVNHEDFLRQIITKNMEYNKKKMKDNNERVLKELMFRIIRRGNNLNLPDQIRDALCEYIDQYLNELYIHRNQLMNQSHLEYGESSSAANVMAPSAIAEVGSSSFANPDVFNSPQLVNESWALKPTIPSSQSQEQINTLGNNFCLAANDQQGYYEMMYPVGIYDQHPNVNLNHDQYDEKFGGHPIVAQDEMVNLVGVYNQHPNLNLNHDQYDQKFGGHPIVVQDGMANPVGVYDQHSKFNLIHEYEHKFGGHPNVFQDGMMNQVGVYDQHPNLNLNHGQYEQKFGGYPIVAQNGMLNPVGVYDHQPNLNLNHNQYDQKFGVNPILAQDGIYKPNQMMMNHPQQVHFPVIDNSHHYFHQQS